MNLDYIKNLPERKAIKELRRIIPDMKCKTGCNECCGPILFTQWEWNRINDRREFRFSQDNMLCPYAETEGCAIYNERPIICRLFGVVPEMICSHGGKTNKILDVATSTAIKRIYQYLVNRYPAKDMHYEITESK